MARVEDIDELRRQLGECLYVVQSFYSNTNWVEMFGGVSYPNFGKKTKYIAFTKYQVLAINQKQEKKTIIKTKQTNKQAKNRTNS